MNWFEQTIRQLFQLSLALPQVGKTFWVFHQNLDSGNLTADETLAAFQKNQSLILQEMVWDEDQTPTARIHQWSIRGEEDLKRVLDQRIQYLL